MLIKTESQLTKVTDPKSSIKPKALSRLGNAKGGFFGEVSKFLVSIGMACFGNVGLMNGSYIK
ncbi:MAG: hypothetical protein ACI9J2_000027 [Saprospiraceae bacterium]|jgi:hypothetical protein